MLVVYLIMRRRVEGGPHLDKTNSTFFRLKTFSPFFGTLNMIRVAIQLEISKFRDVRGSQIILLKVKNHPLL